MVRSVGIPVSIHALLAECDSLRHVGFVCHRVVSIHALLAECDRTLPEKLIPSASFNPRTPCGVRPVFRSLDGKELRFQSTHSLRSATKSRVIPSRADEFQSTHSLRSATLGGDELQVLFAVSIHALLAECDEIRLPGVFPGFGFNPRTPCGVRQFVSDWKHTITWFQSTHSLRSATIRVKYEDCPHIVSIHALLAECDRRRRSSPPSSTRFNPRTPCGVRHAALTY